MDVMEISLNTSTGSTIIIYVLVSTLQYMSSQFYSALGLRIIIIIETLTAIYGLLNSPSCNMKALAKHHAAQSLVFPSTQLHSCGIYLDNFIHQGLYSPLWLSAM